MALLEVRNIHKQFEPGRKAIDNVSLDIHDREILCLLGPSGCGKTTLLRIISGLETPDQGDIEFDGKNIGPVAPFKRDFGMMFQDFALFPHKNVFENIAFGLKMHQMSKARIEERVQEMLDVVDLEGYGEREIDQLSGGEQQRVALARALAPSPRLLMLDEPLGALDRALREKLMVDLRQILKHVGVTAIYVTHDQTEAFAIADRVAVMNEGKIEQIDPPEKLYNNPLNGFVAKFLGLTNILDGQFVAENRFLTNFGELVIEHPAIVHQPEVTILIRPEAGLIVHSEERNIKNLFEAYLKTLSFRGRFYQACIDINGTELILEFGRINKKEGDYFQLVLEPGSILVFSS